MGKLSKVVFLLFLASVSAGALGYYGLSGRLEAAQGLLLTGAAVGAEAELRHALRENPYDIEVWTKLGDLYQSNRRLDEALVAYEQAVTISAGDHDALLRAVIVQIRMGHLSEAETRVAAILERAPMDAAAARVMGWIDVHQALQGAVSIEGLVTDRERTQNADRHFHTALRIDPSDAEAYIGRAVVARLEMRTVDALRLLEQATANETGLYWGWQLLGEVLSDLGRDSDAVAAFTQAQNIGSGRPYSLMELAALSRRADRPLEAAAFMERIGPEGAYNRGVDLMQAGQFPEAEKAFLASLLYDPEDGIALDRLERVRAGVYPADDTRRVELAFRRLGQGEKAEAVNNALLAFQHYRKAILLAPQLSEARLRMARFLDRQGSFTASVIQLQRVEELTRSQTERLVASDLLEVVTRKALMEMETTHQVNFGTLWDQPTSSLGVLIGNPEVLEEKIRWGVNPVPRPRLRIAILPFTEALKPFHVRIGRLTSEWLATTLGLLPGFELIPEETIDAALLRRGAKNADQVDPGQIGQDVGADVVLKGRILEAREDVSIQVSAVKVPAGPVVWQQEYVVRGAESLTRAVLEIARTFAHKVPLEGAVVRRREKGLVTVNLGRVHGMRLGDTVTIQRRSPELFTPGMDWPGRREEVIAQGRVVGLTERYCEVRVVSDNPGLPSATGSLVASLPAVRAGDSVKRRL